MHLDIELDFIFTRPESVQGADDSKYKVCLRSPGLRSKSFKCVFNVFNASEDWLSITEPNSACVSKSANEFHVLTWSIYQKTLIEWQQTWCNTLHISARDIDVTCTHHNDINTLIQLQWAHLTNKLTAVPIHADFRMNISFSLLHVNLTVNNMPDAF